MINNKFKKKNIFNMKMNFKMEFSKYQTKREKDLDLSNNSSNKMNNIKINRKKQNR